MAVYTKVPLSTAPVIASQGVMETMVSTVVLHQVCTFNMSVYAKPDTSAHQLTSALAHIIVEHKLSASSTVILEDFSFNLLSLAS